jgi:hypothetical protein
VANATAVKLRNFIGFSSLIGGIFFGRQSDLRRKKAVRASAVRSLRQAPGDDGVPGAGYPAKYSINHERKEYGRKELYMDAAAAVRIADQGLLE